MARRKKEEVIDEVVEEVSEAVSDTEVIEEVKETEVIEELAERPEFTATVEEISKKSVKVTAPRVNVRRSPSLAGDIQKIAVAGDKFDLISDREDGFYEVISNGEKVFIMKDFTTLV